ncbi:hypothetical protein [Pseudonocardia sp.]
MFDIVSKWMIVDWDVLGAGPVAPRHHVPGLRLDLGPGDLTAP